MPGCLSSAGLESHSGAHEARPDTKCVPGRGVARPRLSCIPICGLRPGASAGPTFDCRVPTQRGAHSAAESASSPDQCFPLVAPPALAQTRQQQTGEQIPRRFTGHHAGTQGCTHLTELCLVLPTAVIQAMAGSVIDTREGDADGNPPFQLDRCHALRRDGETVAKFYPRWQLKSASAVTVS